MLQYGSLQYASHLPTSPAFALVFLYGLDSDLWITDGSVLNRSGPQPHARPCHYQLLNAKLLAFGPYSKALQPQSLFSNRARKRQRERERARESERGREREREAERERDSECALL